MAITAAHSAAPAAPATALCFPEHTQVGTCAACRPDLWATIDLDPPHPSRLTLPVLAGHYLELARKLTAMHRAGYAISAMPGSVPGLLHARRPELGAPGSARGTQR